MATGFSVEDFLAGPTVGQLDLYRKADFCAIGAHFGVELLMSKTWAQLKASVVDLLVKEGVSVEGVEGLLDSQEEVPPVFRVVGSATPPTSRRSSFDGAGSSPRLRVRLARLKLEKEERDRELEYKHQQAMYKLELEARNAVRLKELELEMKRLDVTSGTHLVATQGDNSSQKPFDASRQIGLVPEFRESEVDEYFETFERIATAFKWPPEAWAPLLQSKLIGKARDVMNKMPLRDSMVYATLKETVLRSYSLVPEAYRQRFRVHRKAPEKTFVEFASEKQTLFNRWLKASEVTDFNSLCDLILMEDFKNSLSDRLATYLNEQKVTNVSEAAVLVDEYVITHRQHIDKKDDFEKRDKSESSFKSRSWSGRGSSPPSAERRCFLCHKNDHLIANCPERKNDDRKAESSPIGLCAVRSEPVRVHEGGGSSYEPFMLDDYVSLGSGEKCSIRILRDTGAAQSFILSDILPFNEESSCGSNVLVQGIGMEYLSVPLHCVNLSCDLLAGTFSVGVRPSLPMPGVTILLGNDIAGGKVTPVLEVVQKPNESQSDELGQAYPDVFPVFVVTRAQAKKLGNEVDLSNTFFADGLVDLKKSETTETELKGSAFDSVSLAMTRDDLIAAQKSDTSLNKCFEAVQHPHALKNKDAKYFIENGMLLKWKSRLYTDFSVVQVVVPVRYRHAVLSLAHENAWAGHLGVTKTYDHVLEQFFWPGLKKDVVQYCRTCHTCQVVGKQSRVLKPAPPTSYPCAGQSIRTYPCRLRRPATHDEEG
ncbi:uncharacterized protein LOC130906366 isoform X1 [Corythoichthys intestinalis]|uniref:uncharacterized protein LOC130906366 isoform X1 n=1 Tax=Corythoichthys intestinalis TaxID=161448 RepID=UPI0025A62D75|nr:uncharacterized protein LOC130906366 isoform X1 [Corythoichthys intestinalis]XP_057676608.1 uncharacterized protein LOC130906366 isoform X1 [Corythoichthys intestinalis]XP_057676609.1 uncharacterized protein LOC130906366 isoform X1 [Corythoichthys intestinalis]